MNYTEMALELVQEGIFWFEEAEKKELYDEIIEFRDNFFKKIKIMTGGY